MTAFAVHSWSRVLAGTMIGAALAVLQRALERSSAFCWRVSGMCDKNFLHTLFSAVAQLYDNC